MIFLYLYMPILLISCFQAISVILIRADFVGIKGTEFGH